MNDKIHSGDKQSKKVRNNMKTYYYWEKSVDTGYGTHIQEKGLIQAESKEKAIEFFNDFERSKIIVMNDERITVFSTFIE